MNPFTPARFLLKNKKINDPDLSSGKPMYIFYTGKRIFQIESGIMHQNFLKSFGKTPAALLFLSGPGTNAEKLLRDAAASPDAPWRPLALVTDRPETSRARELASEFHLPLIEHDIFAYYRKNGRPRVSLATEEDLRIREQWTAELREKLRNYPADFGILAGFLTLCNITDDLLCLNVHPGDLTVRENGKRIYAGLHRGPTERAILRGEKSIRSSVILAGKVGMKGAGMDEGPVLGISDPVELDLQGMSLAFLKETAAGRAGKAPAEYADDPLARLALHNVDRLKAAGDWKLFPRVVRDFAKGLFRMEDGVLCYCGEPVSTVWYPDGAAPKPLPPEA